MTIEPPVRIIATTLHHPTMTDAAVSVVFARTEREISIEELLQEIDVKRDETATAWLTLPQGVPPLIGKWVKAAYPTFSVSTLGEPTVDEYFAMLMDEQSVVVEQSPPELAGLLDLVKHASGVAIGAFVGFQVTAGPLLFLTVPAGMIIVGAASGVARALEAGLRDKIAKLIAGRRPRGRPRSQGSSSPPRQRSAGA